MLGHDKAHKVQSVKRNFMLCGLQKMTKHRKADGLRCWHFWYGTWTAGRIFKTLELAYLGIPVLLKETGAAQNYSDLNWPGGSLYGSAVQRFSTNLASELSGFVN